MARLTARWRNPLRATPAADPYAVDILRKLLANARRPALVIGGRRGRLRQQTAEAFSTAFRTPVFVSSGRKGTLDTTAPYYAGTFLNGKLERHLLDDADLVVLVDPESYDFYNRPWCFDAPSVALVTDTFTEWGNPIDEVLPVDPDATLRALLDAGVDAKSEWTPEHVQGYRDHLRTTLLGPDEAAFSVSRAVGGGAGPLAEGRLAGRGRGLQQTAGRDAQRAEHAGPLPGVERTVHDGLCDPGRGCRPARGRGTDPDVPRRRVAADACLRTGHRGRRGHAVG